MEVTEALGRLGGVASARELAGLVPRGRLRRAVRRGEVIRDTQGRYALPTASEALRAANRLTGVVSHLSAAAHWGWQLKWQPEAPCVIVPRNRKVDADRRDGVDLRWRNLRAGDLVGPVTSSLRTVLDCALTLPFDEALAVADSALRHEAVTGNDLVRVAAALAGPGSACARRVALAADSRAANPFESVLRAIALDVRGLDVEPQRSVALGWQVVQPDLVDVGRRLVIEADSFEFHGKRGALVQDCERYNKLTLGDWRILRFSWEHVMLRPDYVRECLDQAVSGPLTI